MNEKDNFVIEVLDKEHSKRVKDYFLELGLGGCNTHHFIADKLYKYRYYGYINGKFNNYSIDEVTDNKAKIVTLLEQRIRDLVELEGKILRQIIIEEVPEIDWFLVWDNGSLKPNIVCKDMESAFENAIPIPKEFNEFINENFK